MNNNLTSIAESKVLCGLQHNGRQSNTNIVSTNEKGEIIGNSDIVHAREEYIEREISDPGNHSRGIETNIGHQDSPNCEPTEVIPSLFDHDNDHELDSWFSDNFGTESYVLKSEPRTRRATRKLDSKLRKFEKECAKKVKSNPIEWKVERCHECDTFIVNHMCKCTSHPSEGYRIKVRRELKHQMNKILKDKKIDQVYWTVDGKAYESLSDTVELICLGYHAKVQHRMKGGMGNDKDDIIEIVEKKSDSDDDFEDDWNPVLDLEDEEYASLTPTAPPQMPPPLPPKPGSLKDKILKQKLKPVFQQASSVVINDLKVIGTRNRETVPDHLVNRTKHIRARTQKIGELGIKKYVAIKDRVEIRLTGPNGSNYMASVALFEGDHAYKHSSLMSKFEDQIQYARQSLFLQNIPVTCVDPLIGRVIVPQSVPDTVNIMTEWTDKILNIWMPEPVEYNPQFDYACRLEGGFIVLAYPHLGSYQTVTYPNKLVPQGENVMIFNKYTFAPSSKLFDPQPLSVDISRSNIKKKILIPGYVLTFAQNWLGGKNMTNFTVVAYLNEFHKWWSKSANSVFEKPDSAEIIAALFHAARLKQTNLFEIMGLNFDILNLQHDNTKAMIELRKHGNLWSYLKTIARWILPVEAFEVAKEAFDNLRYLGFTKGIWEPLRGFFESGIICLFGNSPPMLMKAFTWMNDRSSIFLEELLKCIPGLGLVITIKELITDYRESRLTAFGAITRILFHNWHELLPFWARLATLPIRLAWHYGWNTFSKFKAKEIERHERSIRLVYDKREPAASEFNIIHHDPTYPRFPQSEPITIPDHLKDKEFIRQMLDDNSEEERNPVHVSCTIASSNCAGVKNGNNLMSATIKRNLQAMPLPVLPNSTIKETHSMARFWKHKFHMEEVLTEDWINQPNHGKKKEMYHKAWKQFQEDGNIEYKATLQLKYDEVIMKEMMRTIIAYDNSYVVNVAPTIASISNAMKKTFNGYTNLSRSPKYTLHILYATGMQSHQIAKITQDNMELGCGDVPHFFLKVLGDDSALLHEYASLCCDFSRYDSTQHTEHHETFRDTFTTSWNEDKINMLRVAAKSPVVMFHPNSKEKFTVKPVGLNTGCVETSVSNTFTTALNYACALEKAIQFDFDPFEFIPLYLQYSSGFLPKASIQDIRTGEEFLKTIFIVQEDGIVALPLLSCLAKLGKFLTPPRLIVPLSKIKTDQQIAVDSFLMQIRGKGNMINIPGFKRLYKSLLAMASPGLSPYVASHYGAPRISGDYEVLPDTIATAYETRYGLSWDLVDQFFEKLSEVPKEQYPFTYSSDLVQVAIEKDYGLDPPN
jgi:hypothetical protein